MRLQGNMPLEDHFPDMNMMTAIPAHLTMSCQEVAERTGKLHHHVMRDIREMLEGLGHVATSFGGYYVASNGKRNPCFNLPKRECLILVSGYSVELRAAIVDRRQELEAQQAPRIPTHVEALRLAADAIERADREAEQKQISKEHARKVPKGAPEKCETASTNSSSPVSPSAPPSRRAPGIPRGIAPGRTRGARAWVCKGGGRQWIVPPSGAGAGYATSASDRGNSSTISRASSSTNNTAVRSAGSLSAP